MGSDWMNNFMYVSSCAYKLTPTYETTKKMVDGALKIILRR
jgi:hypothetical protein